MKKEAVQGIQTQDCRLFPNVLILSHRSRPLLLHPKYILYELNVIVIASKLTEYSGGYLLKFSVTTLL